MARQFTTRQPLRYRRAALADVVAALRRLYGERIIRAAADLAAMPRMAGRPVLSTGSLGLDLVTGGLLRGAMTEYAGVDGAGKETLAYTALARCQRGGGLGLLLDADASSDPDALAAVGVDLDRLVLACPVTAEEAWHTLIALARCGALDLLLITSLPGLADLPGADGLRLVHRWLPRLTLALRGRRTATLLTNQPLPTPAHAEIPYRWETVGSASIAQATALRVALRPAGLRFGPHGDVIALGATAAVVKHHGLSHGPALPLEFAAAGTDRARELVALGRLVGCIEETPLGLTTGGVALGRSERRAAAGVGADPDLAAALEARIRRAWREALSSPSTGGAPR